MVVSMEYSVVVTHGPLTPTLLVRFQLLLPTKKRLLPTGQKSFSLNDVFRCRGT